MVILYNVRLACLSKQIQYTFICDLTIRLDKCQCRMIKWHYLLIVSLLKGNPSAMPSETISSTVQTGIPISLCPYKIRI